MAVWTVDNECELVVTVVLSVSFCLSDGCEGQSLLAVSQNGLSLSLASLFSGICRRDGWARLHHSTQTVRCGGAPERKLVAPLRTENLFLLMPPAKTVTLAMCNTFLICWLRKRSNLKTSLRALENCDEHITKF